MQRKSIATAIGAVLLAAVGVTIAASTAPGAARTTTTTQQRVMRAFVQLPTGTGTKYAKLTDATTGAGRLSGRFAVSSITIAQMGGSQPLEVGIRAATCDNSNGYGAIEDVVVPQDQTVHVTYPSAVRMPFVQTAPTSWCLYATTARDGSNLHITVVGIRLP